MTNTIILHNNPLPSNKSLFLLGYPSTLSWHLRPCGQRACCSPLIHCLQLHTFSLTATVSSCFIFYFFLLYLLQHILWPEESLHVSGYCLFFFLPFYNMISGNQTQVISLCEKNLFFFHSHQVATFLSMIQIPQIHSIFKIYVMGLFD